MNRSDERILEQQKMISQGTALVGRLTCLEETLSRLPESKLFDHSSWRRHIGLFTFFRRFLFGSGLKEKARLRRLFALWSPLK